MRHSEKIFSYLKQSAAQIHQRTEHKHTHQRDHNSIWFIQSLREVEKTAMSIYESQEEKEEKKNSSFDRN